MTTTRRLLKAFPLGLWTHDGPPLAAPLRLRSRDGRLAGQLPRVVDQGPLGVGQAAGGGFGG
ncbi:MAG: hypothetical protein ACO3LM_12105, partial [Steroidobacteraceae bacterium]